MRLVKLFFSILIFTQSSFAISFPNDSSAVHLTEIRIKNISFRASLSASYIIQKNYYEQDLTNFLFLSNLEYFNRTIHSKYSSFIQIKSDVGYLKFTDSIWDKQTDSWKISWMLDEFSSQKITHSYSANIFSQWLNSYRYSNMDNDVTKKKWKGGIFNPLMFTFAYNLTANFWQSSYALLGLASIRLNTKPRYIGAIEPVQKPSVTLPHSWILFNYGLSGQLFIIQKKITDNIIWDNSSLIFVNGISKDQVYFDLQNRVAIICLKYLQFRIDTHIIYDPLTNYKLQFNQQFLFGIYFEKKKK